VRSTSRGYLDFVDSLLGERRADAPDEGAAVYRFSALVGRDKELAGGKVAYGVSSLYLGPLRIFRGRGHQEMAGRMVSALRDLLVAPENEYVRIRGTGVTHDGAGILVVAPQPEPRMPALAALLVRHGFGYLGDELVKVEPILDTAHPTPLPILVDELDAALFADAGLDPPRRKSHRAEGMTPRRPLPLRALGGSMGEPAPVRWIVFPEFGAERTSLEATSGAPYLFKLAEATLNMHVWRERALLYHRRLLDSASVSRLAIADVREAASAISAAAPAVLRR
jgi:hypothetical protein